MVFKSVTQCKLPTGGCGQLKRAGAESLLP